jgi:hypothetical protein
MTQRRPVCWSFCLSFAGSTCAVSSRPNSKESKPICFALSMRASPSLSVVKGDVQTQALTPMLIAIGKASFAWCG